MKTLVKYHTALFADRDPAIVGVYDLNTSQGYSQGWRKVGPTTFVSEVILDLAGVAMEDETIFFDGITVQEGGIGNAITGQAGDSFVVLDIVSSIPLDIDGDFGNILLHGAGFPFGGKSNFDHIQYSRTNRFTLDLDTSAAFAFKASSEQSGSLYPTASDRLYIYRLVSIFDFSNALTSMGVASSRVVFAVNTKEEPTYQYLMRLKRSYDLQQEPDVDLV